MEQTIQQAAQPKSKGKKILLIGLSLAATGTLGYFGYQWWRGRKEKAAETESTDLDLSPPTTTSFSIPSGSPARNDEFPLHKGSKGLRVKQLQEALIEKHGKVIMPKYGADGDFGSETVAALAKLNYPSSIDQNTFNMIVQAGGLNSKTVAKELYDGAIKKDISATIKALQKLKSKEDYTSVSEVFKTDYRINGVRQTLVNGLLNSFTDEQHKQSIRLQFTRMGLNYDGSTWSLSGFESLSIITTQPALVWADPKTAIKVPAKMILGKEIAQRANHTLFENNGKHFLVETKTITYLT
jgi:hypothetical protein